MIVPLITSPEEIQSTNYKPVQSVYVDRPVDQIYIYNALSVTKDYFKATTKHKMDLLKLPAKPYLDLYQDREKVGNTIQESTIREIYLELGESSPKYYERGAIAKYILKKLQYAASYENRFQILSLIPVNSSAQNAFTGSRTVELR